MHEFSHQFPTVWENITKAKAWRKSGELILILLPYCGCFLPIRFPSDGILHHMGNAWVSPSIFHSTGKCSKTLVWGKPAKLVLILFP